MTRTAIITGGAQGIGKAVALAFADHGYDVCAADTDKEAGAEFIRDLRRRGGRGMFVPTNVADESDVERLFQLIDEEFGRIDTLINNAGITRQGSMLEEPVAAFDEVLSVNLRGAFLCSRLAGIRMKARQAGSIIHMSSTRALMSEADTEAYAASKGGLLALTHAMAVSLGPYGIRVNAVSPGWIETADWQKSSNRRSPVHSERDRLQHPVGRVGRPEDIAEACLYLAGSKAGFMTGQNLVIDGGMTIKMIYEE